MKKLALLLSVLLFSSSLIGKNLQARLATASFYAPGNGPFIETYLSINGHSTKYISLPSGKFQSAIEVTLLFRQGEKVAYFDKYKLLSPETADTLKDLYNFMDVQRVPLATGTYKMEIIIRDFNATDAKPYTLKQDIIINYQPNVIAVSDIELLQSFSPSVTESKLNRNGYELIPLIDNFFPPEVEKMAFFAEIYNTSSILGNDPYVVSYHIEIVKVL
jgi:hypothetical protein